MFEYFLSFLPKQALICVKIQIKSSHSPTISLQIPAWRPGRYQLQNFARNIRNFSAFDAKGQNLPYQKIDRNTWVISNDLLSDTITVSYEYLATELNAGSSHISESLLYFNPINFTLYQSEFLDSTFVVHVICNDPDLQIASGLSFLKTMNGFVASPASLRQWFDSPVMISNKFIHLQFKSKGVPFHFWVAGGLGFDEKKLVRDLKKIANTQIDLFGTFPESDYHFMLIVPDEAYYHGVEHANSTMLVLGQHKILQESYYYDLLGLASHELFHAWNIAKIRPAELLPYDYSKEAYFGTCFVAEGFTTYYGDKIMQIAGVITDKMYFFELETILRRHFENADSVSQSLVESSIDLWVDGYERAIPHKRVSVYDKGAIVAFMLDATIKEASQNSRSLDDVMRKLWATYGDMQKGYTYAEIQMICEEVAGLSLDGFFKHAVASNMSIWDITQTHLAKGFKKMIKNSEGLIQLVDMEGYLICF